MLSLADWLLQAAQIRLQRIWFSIYRFGDWSVDPESDQILLLLEKWVVVHSNIRAQRSLSKPQCVVETGQSLTSRLAWVLS